MKLIRIARPAAIWRFIIVGVLIAATAPAADAQRRRGRDQRSEDNAAQPSDAERQAIADLTKEIQGTILYARRGHIRRQNLGEWEATDLGEGDSARWSADGARIAVYDGGNIYVMNADGSDRRRIYDNADELEDGAPLEFHTNGKEILFVRRRSGLWSAPVEGGEPQQLKLPAKYTGEPGVSADGKHLVARLDNDLYAVDLTTGRQRKFSRGCGPSVSPSGEWIANNLGSHRQLSLQQWNGDSLRKIDAKLRPDRSWDDFHWSNHEDYLAVQGERDREEAYAINVRTGKAVRVTWEGRIRMPDLFVAPAADAAPSAVAATAGSGNAPDAAAAP